MMKKTMKKTGTLALALMLVLALLPVNALAVDIGMPAPVGSETPYHNDTFMDGTSASPVRVYFGVKGGGGPMPWRVLAADNDSWLLIASDSGIMGNQRFDLTDNTWATSNLRDFLNGPLYGDFLAAEQAAILTSNTSEGTETTQTDKLFVLSVTEANAYFADSVDRQYGASWWLRSPGYNTANAAVVNDDGAVLSGGNFVDYYLAIRSAFRLDLPSVLFTSAAAGGKSVTVGDASLSAAQQPTGAVKLTVYDTTNLAITSATATSVSGRTITFGYTGATTGETLSAIVTASNGTVKYYGQLVAAASNNGTTTVTVPDDFAAGDTLSIFVEQINGDNLTDYASTLTTLSFADQAAPTGLAGVSCTTSANNDGQITGTTVAMEYSIDGTNWLPCTAGITQNLTPGSYLVRMAASGIDTIASTAVTVTVGAFQQTTTSSGTGSSGPIYTQRTLTDTPTGVRVSGSGIANTSRLTVSGGTGSTGLQALHAEGSCAACDEIRRRQAAGEVIVLYNISLTNGHSGPVDVYIPFSGTSGSLHTVLHCNKGMLEEKSASYQDGGVTTSWARLSPFAVLKSTNVSVPDNLVVNPPKTGDASGAPLGFLLLCTGFAGMVAVNIVRKNRRSTNN